MSLHPNRFPDFDEAFSPDAIARIDAAIVKATADAPLQQETAEVELLPEDPDPFGLNWKWLYAAERDRLVEARRDTSVSLTISGSDAASSSQGEAEDPLVSHPTASLRGNSSQRSVATLVLACAASLLLGFLLRSFTFVPSGRPPDQQRFALASATITEQTRVVRGSNDLPSFRISSPHEGFVTVIAVYDELQPDDFFIDPDTTGKPMRITPTSPVDYIFSASVPANTLVFVVTETQADAAIKRAFVRRESLPTTREKMSELVSEILQESGYHWAAIGTSDVRRQKSD